jgi:DNA-binding NtrC family response regulator
MGTSIEIELPAGHPVSHEAPRSDPQGASRSSELDLRGLLPGVVEDDSARAWQSAIPVGSPWASASFSLQLRPEALWLTLWREKAADLSTATRRAMSQLEAAARLDEPVLLTGEPFTGRHDAALALHQLSARAPGPFVELGDAPGNLSRALELAEGGTLYLGEAERLPPDVAQRCQREMARGAPGSEARPVRLVASSVRAQTPTAHQGPPADAVLGEFSGGLVEIPPLRRRRADLPLVIEHLLGRIARRLGRSPPSLSTQAQRALRDYGWPGNFAELETCLAWAVLACAPSAEVQLWDLPLSVRGGSAGDRSTLLSDMVGAVERTAIVEALGQNGNKKIHAAATLGISRPTLDKKIAEYKIRFKRSHL